MNATIGEENVYISGSDVVSNVCSGRSLVCHRLIG